MYSKLLLGPDDFTEFEQYVPSVALTPNSVESYSLSCAFLTGPSLDDSLQPSEYKMERPIRSQQSIPTHPNRPSYYITSQRSTFIYLL